MNRQGNNTHIAFFINSLLYGGAERVVYNLARHFVASKKYKISVILIEDAADFDLPKDIDVITMHNCRLNSFGKIIFFFRDSLRLKNIARDNGIDVVLSFMQRPNAINMLSKALGARHRACASVRCRMGMHYAKTMSIFNRFFGWLIFRWLWRYADKTIVNSKDIKDEVLKLFSIPARDIELIYNPINIEEIDRLSREETGTEHKRIDGDPILINIGNLNVSKGHVYLLKAFASVSAKRRSRLVIIGDGPLKPMLKNMADSLGISDKVEFLGWQSNPYKFLARSSLFVLSSIYEGFPNAILEAMACRCPVVAFDCPSGPREILNPPTEGFGDKGFAESEFGVLVRGHDETALTKAVDFLLNNERLKERLMIAGAKRAGDFKLAAIARQFERVLLGETLYESNFT